MPVTAALLLLGAISNLQAENLAVAAAPPSVALAAETMGERIKVELRHEMARVAPWLDRYGYGAVALAVGVEGAGIPAPGQTLLIAAAADAASHPKLRIGSLLLVAFVAAVIGNTLGYLIGRWGGRALLHRLRLKDHHLERVEGGFARWGGWLIVIARFFDGLRQLNGIAAGVLEMSWRRFTLFNVLGAALWVGSWGLGVYYLDEHLNTILVLIRRLNPWVAAATLIGVGALFVLVWRRVMRRRGAD